MLNADQYIHEQAMFNNKYVPGELVANSFLAFCRKGSCCGSGNQVSVWNSAFPTRTFHGALTRQMVASLYNFYQQSQSNGFLCWEYLPGAPSEREKRWYFHRKDSQLPERVMKSRPTIVEPSSDIHLHIETAAEAFGMSCAEKGRQIRYLQEVSKDHELIFFNAKIEESLRGTVCLRKGSQRTFNLSNLGVHPLFQKNHIGSSLLARALEFTRGHSVVLETTNPVMAEHLMPKFGFQLTGERYFYEVTALHSYFCENEPEQDNRLPSANS